MLFVGAAIVAAPARPKSKVYDSCSDTNLSLHCFSQDDTHFDHVMVLPVFPIVAVFSHTLVLEAYLLVDSDGGFVVFRIEKPGSAGV